jgi:spermidine/putrescine transport system permease protein
MSGKEQTKGWSVEHGVMLGKAGHFLRSLWLSGPGIGWMTIFLVIPLLLIVGMSFMTRSPDGGILIQFTTENYARINAFSGHIEILVRSVFIGVITSATCLLASLPIAFFIISLPKHLKNLALVLVVIPFWTNLLIRTYAWKLLLAPESWFMRPLEIIGLVDVTQPIYPGWTAVLIAMMANFLPFMVLPLYASVEKIDWQQHEAARDLGASGWNAFRSTVLPQIQPGLIAGLVFVFLPATGQFVIPDLLGGEKTFMVGNVLYEEFMVNLDWPFGAAFAVVSLSMVAAGLLIHTRFTRNRKERDPVLL